jgi:DNA-binding IclR family transcriptional regulator
MAGNSSDSGRTVTNKVASILLVFTNGHMYSLTEIARLTLLPISTAHRLATELVAWGILERDEDGYYQAGAHLKMIGSHSPLLPSSLQEKARRVMEDLAAATARTTVRFGVLTDLHVAFVEKLPGARPVSMFHEAAIGPAHATAMGKALLAFSAPCLVDALIEQGLERYTPRTVITAERLRRTLAVTRLTRVAIVRQEWDPKASAVAVPVFGAGGAAVAALELQARDPSSLLRMQAPLVVAARSLSRELAAMHTWGRVVLAAGRRPSAAGRPFEELTHGWSKAG